MIQQQQLLKQGLTISQVLRTYGKYFTQIQNRYSDGQNGRCVNIVSPHAIKKLYVITAANIFRYSEF